MSKVLFFHQRNDFTGSTRVLANVIESEYSGQSVTVITIGKKNGFLSALPNVRIISICYPLLKKKRIPILTGGIWRLHAWLLALVYGWHYDTFYINTITPYYAAVVGRLYRKKLIYHVHEKFIIRSFWVKIFEFVFNSVQAKRIFVSEYVKKQYLLKDGCEAVVKYNTLPKSFLSAVKVIPVERRKRNTVIMITSLTKAKGIFTYIEVARKVPEYKFRLLVSADIEKIKSFFVCELPLNVELISVQSNIHPFLQTSDLVVNLSIPTLWVETFGMTILEAMAYGIPAIVPNVGGPTEIVSDGYNGYCIDVTDVDVVSATVRRIFEKEEYQRLAENSLNRLALFI